MTDERKTAEGVEDSSGKWDQAIGAAVEEASVKKPDRQGRRSSSLRVLVPILAVLLLVMLVTQINRSRLAVLEESRVEQGASTKLILAAGAIEDYVRKTGVLPDSLGDVKIDRMNIEYTKGSGVYELRTSSGSKTLVYRSDHRYVESMDASSAGGS